MIGGQKAALLAILDRFPGKVHLNEDRKALQIEACSEKTIVTHIPLSDALLNAVLSAQERTALSE